MICFFIQFYPKLQLTLQSPAHSLIVLLKYPVEDVAKVYGEDRWVYQGNSLFFANTNKLATNGPIVDIVHGFY